MYQSLSQQKEFKCIKNIVIEGAVRLGEQTEVISQGTATDTSDTPESDSIAQQSIPPSTGPAITVSATTHAAHHSTTIPPAVWTCSTRLLRHMADLFREQEPRLPVGTIRFTDRKLLRKLREKKIAMGHRPDDHEEEGISMR